MKRNLFTCCCFLSLLLFTISGCSGGGGGESAKRTGDPNNPRTYELRMPIEGTSQIVESSGAKIDASNAALGYTIVTCQTNKDKRIKVQIKMGNKSYDFDSSNRGEPEVFPLTQGSGTYTIAVLENVEDTRYVQIAVMETNVNIASEFDPFLVPNQLVDYDGDSSAVKKGYELTKDCGTDLEVVDAVYEYIIENIAYDDDKALAVKNESGYLPNIDDTLAQKKGICFDYSSLAAAILRAHNIPTKLVIGEAYPLITRHAWNMIYIEDVGWVKKELEFDGKSWVLADTTLAASGSKEQVEYMEDNEY